MRRISVKLKITFLYGGLMTLVTCIILAILIALSNREMLSSASTNLKEEVLDTFGLMAYRDGTLWVDKEITEVEDGVYRSVYSATGEFLAGRIPYEFQTARPLADGQLVLEDNGGERWYVYDVRMSVQGYGEVYVLGIASVESADSTTRAIMRISLFLLPLLVLMTAILCYSFTKRLLRPVARITRTAGEISKGADLSKRIAMGEGKDEFHLLANTFDNMLEQLQESFERERRFSADASHELRTPIAVILAQCEAALARETLDDVAREEIQVISRQAGKMSRLVGQLLLLSKGERDQQAVSLEKISLSDIFEMVAEEQRELALERQIRVETDIQPGIEMKADETLMMRMLINLVSNGIAYGRPGGYVKISLWKEGEKVCGAVEDDGIGMSQEVMSHIWERFYQADPSRTTDSAGLGLPMVRWIVRVHGGRIWAESQPGVGSKFSFSF